MTINLETALKIVERSPKHYKVCNVCGKKGFKNVIRYTEEANGRDMVRKQTFDNLGKLVSTERIINDDFSLYSDHTSGLFGLQYFTEVKDPNELFGRRLNRAYAETYPKNLADIRAFYESQAHNMQ